MNTAREARIYVYEKVAAYSLRKRAQTIRARDISDEPLTPAQVERVRKEMVRLAERLEANALRLLGEPEGLDTSDASCQDPSHLPTMESEHVQHSGKAAAE